MKRRVHLQQIAVGKQCNVPWETMHGDGSTRTCASCKTPVHNLSEMSEEQAEQLLARDGDMCVVYYYRADGTIVSSPSCPSTIQRPRSSRIGAVAMTGALATATAFAGISAVTAGTDEVAERGDGTKVACGRILRIKPSTPQQQREAARRRLQRMDKTAPVSDTKSARAEEAEPALDLGLSPPPLASRTVWPLIVFFALGTLATLLLTAWLALGIAPLALFAGVRRARDSDLETR